ncbi:hypothetical protein [Cognataquiflexum rubidum]|uniref:baeRF3 domain-containing protein n=1 Tax=Cognataquiflexum rubidum TaxID=2922273 RepID=UPI001F145DF0|nr:hypothetical protein [Cognataquiflexum rubidum]MCH6233438.1 hypothetical protein [Cognataquiflexum rubidum]
MKLLTKKLVQDLLATTDKTCLSLYMPTHRSHPDNLQDPIRFKNLLKKMEDSLLKKYSKDETNSFIEPLEELIQNPEIWNQNLEGLAVFSAGDWLQVVNLQIPVEELAIVADSFHTKPLRKYLQSSDRFHILGLDRHEMKLFEGNRFSISEIDISEIIPTTIEEALGSELTEKHTTVASYGGTGGESSNMHHGHGGKKDEVDVDTERFFRFASEHVEEYYSKPIGLPLILAALPEHHHTFRKVSKNSHLLKEGIQINPSAISTDKLATMTWELMEPVYLKKLNDLADLFGQAKANGKGSTVIKEVALAATEGRIETLLVEEDKIIAIRITNLVTGNTQNKDLDNPIVDDLLDDMGELVIKMGGEVMVLPADKMPSDTGLAAIYRY